MEEHIEPPEHPPESSAPTGVDPVCGMNVSLESPYRFVLDGTDVFFFSKHCLEKFSYSLAAALIPNVFPSSFRECGTATVYGLLRPVRRGATLTFSGFSSYETAVWLHKTFGAARRYRLCLKLKVPPLSASLYRIVLA